MLEKIVVSSILIIGILIIRAIFQRKISPVLLYSLWFIAALRLLLPGTVGTSPISIMNTGLWKLGSTAVSEEYDRQQDAAKKQMYKEYLETKVMESKMTAGIDEALQIETQAPAQTDTAVDYNSQSENSNKAQESRPAENLSDNNIEVIELKWKPAATLFGRIREYAIAIWFLGIVVCAGIFAGQNLSLYKYLKAGRKKMREVKAGRKTLQVYAAGEKLFSPCIFGLLPSIYIPEGKCSISEEELTFILEHELTHYRHKDHIWSLVRILCLITNWFNPLVWIAAKLSVRDGELACDADCIKKLGEGQRTAYGEALLAMISPVREKEPLFTYATMMTSGGKFIKTRIDNIVNVRRFHKLTAWVMILMVLLCAGCTFTGAEGTQPVEENRTAQTNPNVEAKADEVQLQAEEKADAVQPQTEAQAADYYSRAVVLADEELECKVFLSVTDSVQGESWQNVVLIPADLYLPDLEGTYVRLEELCRSCTAQELEQVLNRDMDLKINELEILSYEELMEKIDENGGITVDIGEREIPYINDHLRAVSGDKEPEDKIYIQESGTQVLHGMQAAAWLQIKYEVPGGYDAWMGRWGQVAAAFLAAEGVPAVEISMDDFSQLDRSLYVEEEDELICFEWEKALSEMHGFLYPEMTYEPSDYVLAADGTQKGTEGGSSMKELVRKAVEDRQSTIDGTCALFGQYMGKSTYMISLLSAEGLDRETADAWNTVLVYAGGTVASLDEDEGRAVFDMSLVFEESGVLAFPESTEKQHIQIQRYLYLCKVDDVWYADGFLHNELPPEEWWDGEKMEWGFYDFGFSDENALGEVQKTKIEEGKKIIVNS